MLTKFASHIKAYLYCRKGATAIEYGLIAAGIALAISASVFFFGDSVASILYNDLPAAIGK